MRPWGRKPVGQTGVILPPAILAGGWVQVARLSGALTPEEPTSI